MKKRSNVFKVFAGILAAIFIAIIVMPVCLAEEAGGTEITIDITGVVVAIVVLTMDLILGWAMKKIMPSLRAWLEAKTSESQRIMIYGIIEEMVQAAEQLFGSGHGDLKREYVAAALRAKGIVVDFDQIEAAVKRMNDKLLKELSIMTESTIEGYADEKNELPPNESDDSDDGV